MEKFFIFVLGASAIVYPLAVGNYIIKKNVILGQVVTAPTISEKFGAVTETNQSATIESSVVITGSSPENKNNPISTTTISKPAVLPASASVSSSNSSVASLQLENESFVDSKNGFSIKVPKGWIINDKSIGSPLKETSYIFFAYQRKAVESIDPRASINIVKASIAGTKGKSLEGALLTVPASDLLAGVSKMYNMDLVWKGDVITRLHGKDVRMIEYELPKDSRRAVVVFYIEGSNAYTLTASSASSFWGEYKDVLKASLLTFTPD